MAGGILANKFREAMRKTKDPRMSDESQISVAYPTGFLNFDFMNGTVVQVNTEDRSFSYPSVGIQDGCLLVAIGRSGCGKTTWAIQTAANIVRNFDEGVIFHDDIEGGVTEYRKKILTKFSDEEMQYKYISRNKGITAENFYERVRELHNQKINNQDVYEYDTGKFDPYGNRIFKLQPSIYIIDSIALLMPEQYTEEESLSGSMSATAAAKVNSMMFKRIIPMLKSANIILIGINHINDKIDINPMQRTKSKVSYLKQGESLPGGNTIIYLTNILLRFDDNSKFKEDSGFGIPGNLVDIQLVKSRNSRAGQTCTLVFDQNNGFDPELSLFIMLKQEGKINGAGAYFYIGDRSDIKFSQKNFKQKLQESSELREIFMTEVLSVLNEKLMGKLEEDKEEEITESVDIVGDIINKLNVA